MAKLQNEVSQVEIRLKLDQANQELKKWTDKLAAAEATLAGMGKDDAGRKKLLTDIETARSKVSKLDSEASKLRTSIRTPVRLVINGDPAQHSLKDLYAAAVVLNREMKAFTNPNDPELKRKQAQFAAITQRIKEMEAPIREARTGFTSLAGSGSINQLKAKISQLRAEVDSLGPSTQRFVDKTRELQQAESRLDRLNRQVKGSTGLWGGLTQSVKQFGVIAAGYLGFNALRTQLAGVIRQNAEFSDSIAKIQRTTGQTREEVVAFVDELRKIPSRTKLADLQEIAAIGGQFNVAKEELKDFVQEVDRLSVVLGDEFSGGAEEVATEMATLRNVLSDIKTENISTDLGKLSNAMVVLAQEGVATAPVVTDMSNRIAGLGIPLGLSSSQVLGLAATMQELGISAERGGTAVGKILQSMVTNVDKFAKVAGKSTEEFKKTVNSNIFEAFKLVLEGSKKTGTQATVLAGIIQDLEVSGVRTSEVFNKLGGNLELLQQRTDLAGTSLQNTDKITQAYAASNSTLAAEIDKLGKKTLNFFQTNAITEFFKKAVQGTSSFIDVLSGLPGFISRNSTALFTLTGALAVYYSRAIAATIASVANTTATLANAAARKVQTVALGIAATASYTYLTVTNLLTGRITAATAASRLFNIVLRANPLGILLTSLTAVVAAFKLYDNNTQQALKVEKARYDQQKKLKEVGDALSETQDRINEQLEHYGQLGQNLRDALIEELSLKKQMAEQDLVMAEARQALIVEQEGQLTYWERLRISSAHFFDSHAAGAAIYQAEEEKMAEAERNHAAELDPLRQSRDFATDSLKRAKEQENAYQLASAISAKTTADYNEKLRLLNIALKNAVVGSEEYFKIQGEIAAQQKELAAKTKVEPISNDDALKALEEYKNKIAQLFAEISAIRIAVIADDEARENASLDDKYQRERDKALKNLQDIKKDNQLSAANKKNFEAETNRLLLGLDKKHEQDKSDLRLKYIQERSDAELEQDLKNLQRGHDNEINDLVNRLFEKKITREQFERESLRIDKEANENRLRLNQEYEAQENANLDQYYRNKSAQLDADLLSGKISQKKYNEEVKNLDERVSGLRIIIAQNFADKKRAITTALLKDEESETEQTTQNLIDIELLRISTAEKNSKVELDLKKEALEKRFETETENLDKTSELYLLKQKELNEALLDLDNQYLLAKVQLFQQGFNLLSSIISDFNGVQNNKENAELQRFKKQQDKKKDLFKKQLDAGIISREKYDSEISKLDDATDARDKEIKRKQFVRNQSANKTQAVINTLLAITRTIAEYPWPINAIFAALTAAAGYAQVRRIESEKPPEFAKGGFIAKGSSHREGGIQLFDRRRKKILGEIEGNEAVISAETTAKRKEVIEDLLKTGGENVIYQQGAVAAAALKAVPPQPGKGPDTDQRAIASKSLAHGGFLEDLITLHDGRTINLDDLLAGLPAPSTPVGSPVATGGQPSQVATVFNQQALPQINSQRIIENLQVQRHGYAAATGNFQESVAPPQKTDPNSDTAYSQDPYKQDMLKTINELRQINSQLVEVLSNPRPQKNYIKYQDWEEAQALIGQVRKQAQVGR